MITQHHLASINRADLDLYAREKESLPPISAVAGKSILRFLTPSTPIMSRSAMAPRVTRYLAGSGFAHSFSNSLSRFT